MLLDFRAGMMGAVYAIPVSWNINLPLHYVIVSKRVGLNHCNAGTGVWK